MLRRTLYRGGGPGRISKHRHHLGRSHNRNEEGREILKGAAVLRYSIKLVQGFRVEGEFDGHEM